jgi:hypothetical protein
LVVPDLKRKLPGRGVWVTARREMVEKAVKRGLFGRAFKSEVGIDPQLAARVEALVEAQSLGALAMAKKAGLVVSGFAKVDADIRQGRARLVLHAMDAAQDGIRKLGQAIHGLADAERPLVKAAFSSGGMDSALGGNNIMHAALLRGGATEALLREITRLERYRN